MFQHHPTGQVSHQVESCDAAPESATACRICTDVEEKLKAEVLLLRMELDEVLGTGSTYSEVEVNRHQLQCSRRVQFQKSLLSEKLGLHGRIGNIREVNDDICRLSKSLSHTETILRSSKREPTQDTIDLTSSSQCGEPERKIAVKKEKNLEQNTPRWCRLSNLVLRAAFPIGCFGLGFFLSKSLVDVRYPMLRLWAVWTERMIGSTKDI